jgi:hypothetical protein
MVKNAKKYLKHKYAKPLLIGVGTTLLVMLMYTPFFDNYVERPGRQHAREYATLLLVTCLGFMLAIGVYQYTAYLRTKKAKGDNKNATSTIKEPRKRK